MNRAKVLLRPSSESQSTRHPATVPPRNSRRWLDPQRVFFLSVAPVLLGASLSGIVSSVPGALMAILGLGLIILIHEFGHFAAAKACNVYVEAFAIGFGPAFVSRKVGETEYRLNILPLGGYVKMLGQDDMDSSQMTSEEVAQDPRSYSAKSVPQRMIIISAGVIMNALTAVLFYMVAFGLGVERLDPLVGSVQAPLPAWQAGVQPGDRITEIDGRPTSHFGDIYIGTALSGSMINVEAQRADGETYSETLTPKFGGVRRIIGVGPALSTTLLALQGQPPAALGSEAATVITKAVGLNTRIESINGDPVANHVELMEAFSKYRDQPVDVLARDGDGQTLHWMIPPVPFREFGIKLDVGKIVAIQSGSVAEENGIEVGDRLSKVDGLEIGKELDPFRVSDYLSDRAGQPVTIRLVRQSASGQQSEVDFSVTPESRLSWETPPSMPTAPLTIPSLGIAFEIIPTVLTVAEGSPAAEAGIEREDTLESVVLTVRPGMEDERRESKPIRYQIGKEASWPHVFWLLQAGPWFDLKLTFRDASAGESQTVELASAPADDWWLPTERGLKLDSSLYKQEATDLASSFQLATTETRAKITEIYLTLRAVVTGNVGVKGLHGPLGILKIAKKVAEMGWSPFFAFLGYISVNLAILNFLPIPVLDGGHMMLLAYEAITRKKPSENFVIAVTNVGLLLLITLFLTCTFFDVSRFFSSVF